MTAQTTDKTAPPNSRPIAVFDSGVGGLSVWRKIVELLPAEGTIYLADQAHVPYGARTHAEIEALTHAATAWLLDQGAKTVVIACNTASAVALNGLRQRWPDVPIVGMEPAVKPASERTRTGKVGVMATPGTLEADRFSSLVQRFASGVEVYTQICPGLVQLVERGQLNGRETEQRLRQCLGPLTAAGIDHLVLGCTHYPFLAPAIQNVVGEDVVLLDPAPAVARQVQRVLTEGCLRSTAVTEPHHRFISTAAPDRLAAALKNLLGLDGIEVEAASLT